MNSKCRLSKCEPNINKQRKGKKYTNSVIPHPVTDKMRENSTCSDKTFQNIHTPASMPAINKVFQYITRLIQLESVCYNFMTNSSKAQAYAMQYVCTRSMVFDAAQHSSAVLFSFSFQIVTFYVNQRYAIEHGAGYNLDCIELDCVQNVITQQKYS